MRPPRDGPEAESASTSQQQPQRRVSARRQHAADEAPSRRQSLDHGSMGLGRASFVPNLGRISMPSLTYVERSAQSLTFRWQSYERRRARAKCAAVVEAAIEFLRLMTSPKAIDILDPHQWEQMDRREREANEAADASGSGSSRSVPMSDEDEEGLDSSSAMPKSAVKYAQALMFVFQRKAGMIASCMWGWGFIVNQLEADPAGATLRWSAPSFFKLQQVSLGVTFGFCNRMSCLALTQRETVEMVMYGRPLLGLDVNVVMDYLQAAYEGAVKYEKPQKSRLHTDMDDRLFGASYDSLNGSMIDCSCKLGYSHVSDRFHHSLYGRAAAPEDILFGRVPHPPEFQPLYDFLHQLSAESPL